MDLVKGVRQIVEGEMMAGVGELYVSASAKNKKAAKLPVGEDGILDLVKGNVSVCKLCALAAKRNNTVFGEGSSSAKLMFVGEAPGRDEDIQGKPFVGRAGKLLTDIIEAMGLKRDDVYIANILKCRPPENRNPLPEEIVKCSPYLLRQIQTIKPRVICTLGKFASQTLLETETSISALRGKFHDYHGLKLMPTYHPAYLLRNPSSKKEVWNDMKAIARELGIKIPPVKSKTK